MIGDHQTQQGKAQGIDHIIARLAQPQLQLPDAVYHGAAVELQVVQLLAFQQLSKTAHRLLGNKIHHIGVIVAVQRRAQIHHQQQHKNTNQYNKRRRP